MDNRPLTDEERAAFNKKSKRIIKITLLLMLIILLFSIISKIIKTPAINKYKGSKWDIVSTQDYKRDGQDCRGYRVYVSSEIWNNDNLKDIFSIVTDDRYYLHTVWFYKTKSNADGGSEADAIMEQTIKGEIPYIKK